MSETALVPEKTRGRPKAQSQKAESEIDRLHKKFEEYDQKIKDLTLDRMNAAPKQEVEPQTKLSQNEIAKSTDIYLKPAKSIGSREKFNERFRDEWNIAKEYVHFIAENKEIIGERIEMWTKPYAGVPAEFWEIPTNKPVWAPRYVAEQISRCNYHRLMTDQKTITTSDEMGEYHGTLIVDKTIARLEANPVQNKKALFMGSKSF